MDNKTYKIQRRIGGEWVDWSNTTSIGMTREQADQMIFQFVAMAEEGESAKNINNWRPMEIK